MPGICTNAVRDSGGDCDHLTLTVNLDGVPHTIKTGCHDRRWNNALDADERVLMLQLLARWWKSKGANLASFAGRVLAGEEGNNVRQFVILGKDVTKTNIGTAYVNIPPGMNGERVDVDFTGFTQFRVVARFNLIGTGTHNWRLIDDANANNVLIESSNFTGAGEKESNGGWQSLPAWATGEKLIRLQGKSTVGADDPVYRGCVLLLK